MSTIADWLSSDSKTEPSALLAKGKYVALSNSTAQRMMNDTRIQCTFFECCEFQCTHSILVYFFTFFLCSFARFCTCSSFCRLQLVRNAQQNLFVIPHLIVQKTACANSCRNYVRKIHENLVCTYVPDLFPLLSAAGPWVPVVAHLHREGGTVG